MSLSFSKEDREFQRRFESCEIPAGSFDHSSHVRLAYIYLCDMDVPSTYERVREALHKYLDHHGADPAKYHETITQAWILAVKHFMVQSSDHASFQSFVNANPELLNTEIMKTHYSESRLFSDEARRQFLDPDLDPIPFND